MRGFCIQCGRPHSGQCEPVERTAPNDVSRFAALDALRSISLWITLVELQTDCDYDNGERRADGGNAFSDLQKIKPKIEAAIAALETC